MDAKKIIYSKKFYILLVLFAIALCYFFWPKTFRNINENQVAISISKDMNGKVYYYDFNDQEITDFVNILEKSKFRHGVSWPDQTFADRYVTVSIISYLGLINISIYYDTDKTYTNALIPAKIILNNKYRISNKDEINNYIKDIITTKNDEFYQSDYHTQEWKWEK